MPHLIAAALDDLASLVRTLRMAGAGSADTLANDMLDDIKAIRRNLVEDGSEGATALADKLGTLLADAPSGSALADALDALVLGTDAPAAAEEDEDAPTSVETSDMPALEADLDEDDDPIVAEDDLDDEDFDEDYYDDYEDGPQIMAIRVQLLDGGVVTDEILDEALAAAKPMVAGEEITVTDAGTAGTKRTVVAELARWSGSFYDESVKLPSWTGSVRTAAGLATLTGYASDPESENALPFGDLDALYAKLDEMAEQSHEARAEWDEDYQREDVPNRFQATYRRTNGEALTDADLGTLVELSIPLLSQQLGTLVAVDVTAGDYEGVVTYEITAPGPLSLEHLGSRFSANWVADIPGIGEITSSLRSYREPVTA